MPQSLAVDGGKRPQVMPYGHNSQATHFGIKESVESGGLFGQALAKNIVNIRREGCIHKSPYCKAKTIATKEI